MAAMENAYKCLTEIQGFESFHLSPKSNIEEIQRAYHTQCMIWHPDKNPGDVEALKHYKLLQRAYNTLMDPVSRAAHDARLLERSVEHEPQPLPEVANEPSIPLREPPPMPQQQPRPEDLGAPPSSAKPFAYVDKEPQPHTPAADAGLLRGDAIVRIGDASHLKDVQAQLQAGLHQPVPVLVVELSGRFVKKWVVPHSWDPWAPASLLGCQMSDTCPLDLQSQHPLLILERQRMLDEARLTAGGGEDLLGDDEHLSSDEQRFPGFITTPCLARLLLGLFSLFGLALGGSIILYPAYSYHIFNIWQLPSLDCSEGGDADAAGRLLAHAQPHLLGGGAAAAGAASRLLAHGGASEAAGILRLSSAAWTDAGADLFRDGVRFILSASLVICLISLVGLCLACSRSAHTKGVLTGVYLCLGLPSWVLLCFVSVVSFALRDKADALVLRYWHCLKSVAPDPQLAQDQLPEAYHHVEMAAGICIASAIVLMVGMACACRMIGFHALARQAIICISVGTGLLGAALLAVGVVLYLTTALAKMYFDYALMGLGAVVFLASLFGVIGSKRESPCLLRAYSTSLSVVLLALLACAGMLAAAGSEQVEKWLDGHWNSVVQKHVFELHREEFDELVAKHVLGFVTLLVLIVLVLAFDLLMVWVLQCHVSRYGRMFQRAGTSGGAYGAAESSDLELLPKSSAASTFSEAV